MIKKCGALRGVFIVALVSIGLTFPTFSMAKKVNPRIEKFLSEFNAVKSPDELHRLLKGAHLSKRDIEILVTELKKPEYSKKIKSLVRKSRSSKRMAFEKPGKGGMQPLKKGKLNSLKRKQLQSIKQKNLEVKRQLHKSARPGTQIGRAQPVRGGGVQKIRATPQIKATAGNYGDGEVSPARIMSVTVPQKIGTEINIFGDHFGTAPGRVGVLFETRQQVNCLIRTWKDNTIRILLPLKLAEIVDTQPKDAALWIKLAGSDLGPYTMIRLSPIVPRIIALSSINISPGQELLIGGENLISESAPCRVKITLRRNDRPYELPINLVSCGEERIHLKISSSVVGLIEQQGTLTVSNGSGKTATTRVTFKPLIDYYDYRVGDSIWNTHTDTILNFFRSFIGEVKIETYFEDKELENTWVVDSSSLEVHGTGGHGANILERPVPGSRSPKIKIEYWADGFSSVRFSACIAVKGPKGLRP